MMGRAKRVPLFLHLRSRRCTYSAVVMDFGSQPIKTVRLAPGPSSESHHMRRPQREERNRYSHLYGARRDKQILR